jgi:hypothetical protein
MTNEDRQHQTAVNNLLQSIGEDKTDALASFFSVFAKSNAQS